MTFHSWLPWDRNDAGDNFDPQRERRPQDQAWRPRGIHEKNKKIPFIIDSIDDLGPLDVYKEISYVCVNSFFNDGGSPDRPIPFFKARQIRHLRQLQEQDLQERRENDPAQESNFMLVARRIVPVPKSLKSQQQQQQLRQQQQQQEEQYSNPYNYNYNYNSMNGIGNHMVVSEAQARGGENDLEFLTPSDWRRVYNRPAEVETNGSTLTTDYVRGDVLGFVEVTRRPYRGLDPSTMYPVLTNLSVLYEARQSGVGSKLLDACEETVLRKWKGNEMILDVVEGNRRVIAFYQKRGYEIILRITNSRRFDANGFVLRQLQCNRLVFRKTFTTNYIL